MAKFCEEHMSKIEFPVQNHWQYYIHGFNTAKVYVLSVKAVASLA